MRIISYNVNGIRAAINKGFLDWLKTDPADVICLQETKAVKENVDHDIFSSLGYQDYWFSAQKNGYSGVAVLTKIKPDNVQYGTGHKVSDDEGRVLQLDFGDTRLINAYFPSGTTGEVRQTFKYVWLDEFFAYLTELKKKYPDGSVQREQYLRSKDGSIAKDPLTEEARRIDHVVIQEGEAVDSVETTSQTADKADQIAKEGRIRDNGGTYVRDRDTGKLVDVKDKPTRIVRKP